MRQRPAVIERIEDPVVAVVGHRAGRGVGGDVGDGIAELVHRRHRQRIGGTRGAGHEVAARQREHRHHRRGTRKARQRQHQPSPHCTERSAPGRRHAILFQVRPGHEPPRPFSSKADTAPHEENATRQRAGVLRPPAPEDTDAGHICLLRNLNAAMVTTILTVLSSNQRGRNKDSVILGAPQPEKNLRPATGRRRGGTSIPIRDSARRSAGGTNVATCPCGRCDAPHPGTGRLRQGFAKQFSEINTRRMADRTASAMMGNRCSCRARSASGAFKRGRWLPWREEGA